jgi:hypothetical protein
LSNSIEFQLLCCTKIYDSHSRSIGCVLLADIAHIFSVLFEQLRLFFFLTCGTIEPFVMPCLLLVSLEALELVSSTPIIRIVRMLKSKFSNFWRQSGVEVDFHQSRSRFFTEAGAKFSKNTYHHFLLSGQSKQIRFANLYGPSLRVCSVFADTAFLQAKQRLSKAFRP